MLPKPIDLAVAAIKVEAVIEVLLEVTEALTSTPDLTDADNAIMYLRHLQRKLAAEVAANN